MWGWRGSPSLAHRDTTSSLTIQLDTAMLIWHVLGVTLEIEKDQVLGSSLGILTTFKQHDTMIHGATPDTLESINVQQHFIRQFTKLRTALGTYLIASYSISDSSYLLLHPT